VINRSSQLDTTGNSNNVQTNNLVSDYKSWSYTTQTNNGAYNIFYITWDKDTYIHIIDNNQRIHLATFLFSPNNQPKSFYYSNNKMINRHVDLQNYIPDNDVANNTMVIEPMYDSNKKIHQLSHYVKYDLNNSNLIIVKENLNVLWVSDINNHVTIINKNNQNANNVSNNSKPNISSNSSSFNPYIEPDFLGQKVILYIPNNEKVLIALISFNDNTLSNYVLANVYRFDLNGLQSGNQANNQDNNQTNQNNQMNQNNNPLSNYYNSSFNLPVNSCNSNMQNNVQNAIQNTIQNNMQDTTQNIMQNMNDYILKTQIVPPVCPTCPTCPSIGTCTNCGGNGGSGTLTQTGNSMIADNSNNNLSKTTQTQQTIQTNPDTIGGTVTGVANAGAGAVTGIANAGADVITGVANAGAGVANNLISTTGSILKPGQSNYNMYGQSQSSGSSTGQNQRSTPGYTPSGLGTNNQYNDPYSYYGQLPAKGITNYVPVTADFSRFGR
jgi:hypothetical protein